MENLELDKNNDYFYDDKLKDISPPLSTSTSLSLSPPPLQCELISNQPSPPTSLILQPNIPQFINTNIVNISPLSSSSSSPSSSSCYTNSSKTFSSSSNHEFLMKQAEKSFNKSAIPDCASRVTEVLPQQMYSTTKSQFIYENRITNKLNEHQSLLCNQSQEKKNEPMSFGKKLRRFLSLNSGSSKRQERQVEDNFVQISSRTDTRQSYSVKNKNKT